MNIIQVHAELKREAEMRNYVYPSLIQKGRITPLEAELRNQKLAAAIEILEVLLDEGIDSPQHLSQMIRRESPPPKPTPRSR